MNELKNEPLRAVKLPGITISECLNHVKFPSILRGEVQKVNKSRIKMENSLDKGYRLKRSPWNNLVDLGMFKDDNRLLAEEFMLILHKKSNKSAVIRELIKDLYKEALQVMSNIIMEERNKKPGDNSVKTKAVGRKPKVKKQDNE